jgi:hypothetical protein
LAAYEQDDYERTMTYLAEAFPLLGELGDREILAEGLELAAYTIAGQGHMDRAALVAGAAERLRQALGLPLATSEQDAHELLVPAMRATLGEEAFTIAWAQGRTLPLDQVLARVLLQ